MESSKTVKYLKAIFAFYGLGLAIATIYYQGVFLANNDFMEWVFFGWVIPLLKALIWPYYLGIALYHFFF